MCLDPRFSCPNQRPSRNKRVFPRVSQRSFSAVEERRIPTYVISNVSPSISRTSVANQVTRCHESETETSRSLSTSFSFDRPISRRSRSTNVTVAYIPLLILIPENCSCVDKSTTLEITGSRRKRQIQNRSDR